MFVRIRVSPTAKLRGDPALHASIASVAAGIMTLLAVSCAMLALWRVTSDVGWTENFVIEDGFLSHWQVWVALTTGSTTLAFRLTRYARAREQAALLRRAAALSHAGGNANERVKNAGR